MVENFRYLDTNVYIVRQGESKISLLQSKAKYPLSKFYSEDGEVYAMTNCSYFATDYVLGRNQGDTFNDAPDQDFYSVVIRADGSYNCGILPSWEDRDGIVAGFSPSVVLIKDGEDVELLSGAITDAKSRLTTRNPNTAFGIKSDGEAILVVNSGRLAYSKGLTGRELRAFLKERFKLDLLVLLDGGGSSEMIVNGNIQNQLSDGKERAMFNALAFIDDKPSQDAVLPLRHTWVSQGMFGSYSHVGTKAIDFGSLSDYQDYNLYAPFDCRVVWADDVSKGGTIALQSIKPVRWANGNEDWMTVISEHSNDRPEKGKFFKQGEIYAHMGTAGNVSRHTHIEVQRGKYKAFTGYLWQSGINAKVYNFPNTVPPYEALFLSPDTIMNEASVVKYPWKRIPSVTEKVERNADMNQVKTLVKLLRVRIEPSTSSESLGYAEENAYYNYYDTKEDDKYTWYMIAENQWVADNGEWLEVLPRRDSYERLLEQISELENKNSRLEQTIAEIREDFEVKDAEANAYRKKLDAIKEIVL